jgi:hypothetical protein
MKVKDLREREREMKREKKKEVIICFNYLHLGTAVLEPKLNLAWF